MYKTVITLFVTLFVGLSSFILGELGASKEVQTVAYELAAPNMISVLFFALLVEVGTMTRKLVMLSAFSLSLLNQICYVFEWGLGNWVYIYIGVIILLSYVFFLICRGK